jgi:hypothetical protein
MTTETTREILVALRTQCVAEFRSQVERLPLGRRTREDLITGFIDGFNTATRRLCEMLEVTVHE